MTCHEYTPGTFSSIMGWPFAHPYAAPRGGCSLLAVRGEGEFVQHAEFTAHVLDKQDALVA